MEKHIIKIYPVGNGDTSLIRLDDKTTILIDCLIRDSKENSDGNIIFNVKDDLLNSIGRKDKKPFVDLFILSHTDEDHCLGFEKHFFNNKPLGDYNEDDSEAQKIVIGELWVTSNVFNINNCKCDDARAIRKEALRRKELYDKNNSSKEQHGNKLRIIGYDRNESLKNVPNYLPGLPTINKINQTVTKNFEIFIHSPFKEELQRAYAEKNNTSIVIQTRFKNDNEDTFNGKILFGGDADHFVWEKILNVTENKNNQDYLEWDIFLAPHHCSWSFFNNRPYKDNQKPKNSSKSIIGNAYRKHGAYIIASSKIIKDDEDNPPHYPAKLEYINEVTSGFFLNTSSEPNEKEPKPIVFEFVSKNEGFEIVKKNVSAGAYIASTRPHRAG